MRHFFIISVSIFCTTSLFAQQHISVDDFIRKQKVQKSDLGELLRKQGIGHVIKGEYSSAVLFYNEALEQFNISQDSIGIAKIWNNLAYISLQNNLPKEALKYYYESLSIFISLKDTEGKIMIFTNLARFFYGQGDHSKSIEYYLKAEGLLENFEDKKRLANVNMGLARIIHLEKRRLLFDSLTL